MNLLTVHNLTVRVNDQNQKQIVDSVSFDVSQNEIVAIVGASGSGKSTIGLSILNLLAQGLSISSGEILFDGKNLLQLGSDELNAYRGRQISMVFQEPLNAFNPLLTIGDQIKEVLITHGAFVPTQEVVKKVLNLLTVVEIEDPSRVARSFPHQLSGGLRQRAMIAQAIAAGPKLIIADEPTSNLDVTIQARIMELFRKLKKELNLSILLISHDLGMVSHLAQRIIVLSEGRVVEFGRTAEVLKNPQHPFTKKFLRVELL